MITLHDPLDGWFNKVLDMYQTPSQHFISISNNQRLPKPKLNYAATIYNGLDLDEFTPNLKAGKYLFYAGRIVPEKGVKEAVALAVKTNQELVIAGPVFPDNRTYFNKHVKPFLGEKIKYIGYIERHNLPKYYQQAKALLMPIQWDEPFGLNIIEAMACGTPVIALSRGSVLELIVDGKTGFIANSLEEMAGAIKKIDTIDRQACRQHVENNFSNEKMIKNYEATFKKIIS